MFKSIAFLLLAIFLGTSLALLCKNCNVDCENIQDEECIEPGDQQEVACLVEKFKDEHNTTLSQRKCVLYEKDTKYECVDYPGYSTISCITCKVDRCNGLEAYGEELSPNNKTKPKV